MKFILSLLFLISFTVVFGQNRFEYKKSKTIITVDTISPWLSGNYLKTVNKKTVELGYFKNGNKDGKWLSFNYKGIKIKAFNYNNGRLDGHQEMFNFDGSKRYSGYFKEGKANGLWEYFNNKGVLIMSGKYISGSAQGKWKIFDYMGKEVIAEYDFDQQKMIIDGISKFESKGEGIIQDAFSGEWFFSMFFKRDEIATAKPFFGYPIANYMFSYFMEVQNEFWDKYLNKVYSVNITFKDNAVDSVVVELLKDYNGGNPVFQYIISTNDKRKLKHIDFYDISLKMLEMNIEENFMISGPWITKEPNLEFIMVYNINDWHK